MFLRQVSLTVDSSTIMLQDTTERRYPRKGEFYCSFVFGMIVGPHLCSQDDGEFLIPPAYCAIYQMVQH